MRRSTRTCRLQGLSCDVTDERLNQLVIELCTRPTGLRTSLLSSFNSLSQSFRSLPGDQDPVVLGTSLTTRGDVQTATVTYRTANKKQRCLRSFRHSSECERVDDEFEGVTMLYGGNNEPIDLDICAVHGLDGHAFDTWMAPTRMWLRDHLPARFPKSRIMTFGYNSNSMDGKSINQSLENFADSLIDALKHVRSSDEEQQRPVLLICHSMGGLVGRLAVTRHWRWREEGMKFKSINFVPYGLLFLSTPHSGTDMANFSDLALDFASIMAGLRKNLVEELKTFNPSLRGIMDDWKTIKPQPVIRCLCETDLTKTPGGYKQIVSSVSAGFMGTTAETVAGTNHNTVCRFETEFDKGWPKVLDSIQELRRELLEQTIEMSREPENVIEMSREPENIYIPGRPPISAPFFPAAENLFYFNEIDRQPSKQFVGRAELLEDIESQVNESYRISKTALTGIAGAGKTETLLHLGEKYRLSRNVFLLPSSGDQDLRDAVQNVATMIGHDLMIGNSTRDPQPQLWNSLTPEIQQRMFMSWVDRGPASGRSLVMLDDLNGLEHERHRSNVTLKNTTTIISARDPTEARKMGFEIKQVSSFNLEDMVSLLKCRTAEADLPWLSESRYEGQLRQLARNLDFHAFAACAAATSLYYLDLENHTSADGELLQRYNGMIRNSGTEAHGRLLGIKLSEQGNRSIMQLYKSSIERLRHNSPSTGICSIDMLELMVFLQLVPFMENVPSHLCIFDFHDKASSRFEEASQHHPQLNLNAVFLKQPGEILHEFITASVGIRSHRHTLIPALWRACAMQNCADERKEYWLQQILLVCFHIYQKGSPEEYGAIAPYVHNCMRIAQRFDIQDERLVLAGENTDELLDWVRDNRQRD